MIDRDATRLISESPERSKVKTKEEVFRNSQQGFAVGFALPHDDGDLQCVRVIELEVSDRREAAGTLATRLIAALGTIPARGLVQRGAQLSRLFDEYSKNDILLGIVFTSAHLLTPRALYGLRFMTEFSNVSFRKYSPAIVLLGHPDKILRTASRYPGVALRSASMPTPRPRLISW